MIHPSYTELIEAINTNNEDDDTTMSVNSRYSLVLATSKRARQLIAGAKPLAIDELYKGKVKILAPEEEIEEKAAAVETAEAPVEVTAEETVETAEDTATEEA